MESGENETRHFRVLPLQVIETREGFILRRGSERFMIKGEGASEMIRFLRVLQDEAGFSLASLQQHFSKPELEKVKYVIRELANRDMIIEGDDVVKKERGEDVFYWNHKASTSRVIHLLQECEFAIAGIGHLTLELVRALAFNGLQSVSILDDRVLRTLDLFDEDQFVGEWPATIKSRVWAPDEWLSQSHSEMTWVIGCSDFGGRQMLQPWNERCIEKGFRFLPVLLQEFTGWIGPVVIPGETPCFHCLTMRQNMHLEEQDIAVEKAVAREQKVVGSHPSMFRILAEHALLRILADIGQFPSQDPDSVLHIDFVTGQSTMKRVLKIPRCPVCSPINRYPATDPYPLQSLPKEE